MQKIVNGILQRSGLVPANQPVTVKNWAASLLATKITEILEKLEASKSDINHTHASSVPVGAIFAFPVDGEVSGYLKCNGTVYTKTQYPKLAMILAEFSPSNAEQFSVPDLRGQYLRGADETTTNHVDPFGAIELKTGNTSNITAKAGIKLPDSFKSHNHSVSDPGHSHSGGQEPHWHFVSTSIDTNTNVTVDGAPWYGGPTVDGINDVINYQAGTTAAQPQVYIGSSISNISVQNSGQVETRPKTVLVNYYIKCD